MLLGNYILKQYRKFCKPIVSVTIKLYCLAKKISVFCKLIAFKKCYNINAVVTVKEKKMTETIYYFVEVDFDNEDFDRYFFDNRDEAEIFFEKQKEESDSYNNEERRLTKISLEYSLFTDERFEKTKESLLEYARENVDDDITFMLNSERNMFEYTLVQNVDGILEEVDY